MRSLKAGQEGHGDLSCSFLYASSLRLCVYHSAVATASVHKEPLRTPFSSLGTTLPGSLTLGSTLKIPPRNTDGCQMGGKRFSVRVQKGKQGSKGCGTSGLSVLETPVGQGHPLFPNKADWSQLEQTPQVQEHFRGPEGNL